MTRFFTFLFCCLSSLIIAQVTIATDMDTIKTVGFANDFQISGEVSLTNNGPASIFTWIRDDSGFVEGWESGVYDKNQCWFPTVDSKSFELISGETAKLKLHMYPHFICGSGHADISLTDDNDASNTITIRYEYEALLEDGSECATTNSTYDFKFDEINIYPNPTNNFFTLTDLPLDIELIHVYNILGSKVKSYNTMQNPYYDISDLTSGLYLVNLTNSKGENLNTIKLYKN